MKRTILYTIALLFFSFQFSRVFAQVPQKMSYQAIVRNANNNLIANTMVGMQISIIQGTETGAAVYVETHMAKTNNNGLVTLAIGDGTAIKGAFDRIKWADGPFFVKTETDPSGGKNYTISGISQLMSVPFALYAVSSGSGTGLPGKSAYEIWKSQPGNNNKTEVQFLESLKGDKGVQGAQGIQGLPGVAGAAGAAGTSGKSAYEVWKAQPGNDAKTETDFILAIKGMPGVDGQKGEAGIPGVDGKKGERGEKGEKGLDGKSAYEVWKAQPGNDAKTETDFILAIKGMPGVDGQKGERGDKGEKGEPGTGSGGAGEKGEKGEAGQKGEKGLDGKSAYEVWKAQPGNDAKTETDFILAIKGMPGVDGQKGERGDKGEKGEPGTGSGGVGEKGERGEKGEKGLDGKSAYEVWKAQPGNDAKTETDFILAIKGMPGVDGQKGEAGVPGVDGQKGERGERGEIGIPGEKGLQGEKGVDGQKGENGDRGEPGERGTDGKSAFQVWQTLPGNDKKEIEDYYADIKGKDGKSVLNGVADPDGSAGKSGDFYINTGAQILFGPKGEDGKWPAGVSLKGVDAIGFDFKGSYLNLDAYKAVEGNTETLNKAYYDVTQKKSFVYNGTEWKMFAQDGTGGTGGGELNFNVDRNITRNALPGFGQNLGKGKTTAQFLEEFFFPRVAATLPETTFGTSKTFPYSEWKNWPSFATNVILNWSVTNKSKQDDSDDKDITSIKLLAEDKSVLATAVPDSKLITQSGTFTGVEFKNPTGSKTVDFSRTYTLEVKDAEPNTVTKTVTLTMNKAILLSYGTPSLNPGALTYEFSNSDIPLTLNWSISPGDEIIKDIKVEGVSAGTTATSGSKQVIFKSPINGGAMSQSFKLEVTGDISGTSSKNTAVINWLGKSYYGSLTSAVSPCNGSFSITDEQVTALKSVALGATLKGSTGYDIDYSAAGQYTVFAYPDDSAVPVVEYFDPNANVWQQYPASQLKIIDRSLKNANGYSSKYKIVLVCVQYVDTKAKIRIK